MTHDEIKKLLPAYCSGETTPVERAWIEEHLSSCRSCRADLADLKTTLKLIRDTPEVEPPPWLTSRIMAGILDQPEPSRGWLQKLFFPLHVKLPVEILAILIVCVTGYYLTQDSSDEIKQVIPQLQQTAPAVIPSEPRPQEAEKQTAAATASGTDKPLQKQRKDNYKKQPVPSPVSQSFKPMPEQVAVVPPASPAPRDKGYETTDSSTGIKSRSSKTITGTHSRDEQAAPVMKKSVKRAKKQAAESAAGIPVDHAAEMRAVAKPAGLKVRLQAHDDATAEEAVRQAVSSSGGNITEGTAPSGSRQLKVQIPAAKARELLDSLERVGRITERPVIKESTSSVDLEISW